MKRAIHSDHSPLIPNSSRDTQRSTKLLLTGATGFLGAELLARLLTRRPEPIICLVRGDSDHAAAERGRRALTKVLRRDLSRSEEARLQWVRADLEVAGLGLSTEVRAQVTSEIREIFHCAASTRFDLPFAESERVNVQGAREVFELAREAAADHSFHRLHHVSTAYVSGTSRGHVDARGLPADGPHRFRNNYERSKASAERFLRDQKEVPCTVYRPSIIVGDSRNGRTQSWNVIYPILRMIDSGQLRFFPTSSERLLDIVPIDFVADGILALGERPDSAGETYHLTAGPEALTIREFFVEAYRGMERNGRRSSGVRTRLIGSLEWRILRAIARYGSERFSRLSRREFLGRRRLVRAIEAYAPYGQVRCNFETGREHALLSESGVHLSDGRQSLARVIDFAIAHGFGSADGGLKQKPRARRREAALTHKCTALEVLHSLPVRKPA